MIAVVLGSVLDTNAARHCERRMATALDRGRTGFLIDMSQTILCNSSGLAALVRAAWKVREAGGCVIVYGRPRLRRLFEVSGASRVMTFAAEPEDAQIA